MGHPIFLLQGDSVTRSNDEIQNGQDRLTAVEVKLDHVQEVIEIKLGHFEASQTEMNRALIPVSDAIQRLTAIAEKQRNLEERVTALEKWKNSVLIRISAITGAVSALWYLAGDKISKLLN